MNHIVTPWEAFESWAWERLRRRPDYHKDYNKIKELGLTFENIGPDAIKIIAQQSFPTMQKWGLLLPANPDLDAGEAHVFWHPDVLKSVLRFHIVDEARVKHEANPFKLCDFPAKRTHFLDVDGTYHLRLLGQKFWFQLRCSDVDLDDENISLGFNFNNGFAIENGLDAVHNLHGLYTGLLPENSPIHSPSRPALYHNAALAFDAKTTGGTWKDAAIAIYGEKYWNNNSHQIPVMKQNARNAYRRAESLIYGQYLDFLDRN